MQNFFLKLISAVSLKALILFLVSCELFAYENVSSMLSEQAKAFVENNIQVDESANIKVTASSIDERINIPPCDEMFEFNASNSSLKQSNVSVKITCPSTAWYLFTNVKVAQTKPIVVGIAQQDGNLGDTIRVKNTGSKKVVSATVASTNEVSVMF